MTSTHRRAVWTWGVASSHDELDAADLRFWRDATPSERWNAVVELALELDALRDDHAPQSGLQRSVGGVRRREG